MLTFHQNDLDDIKIFKDWILYLLNPSTSVKIKLEHLETNYSNQEFESLIVKIMKVLIAISYVIHKDHEDYSFLLIDKSLEEHVNNELHISNTSEEKSILFLALILECSVRIIRIDSGNITVLPYNFGKKDVLNLICINDICHPLITNEMKLYEEQDQITRERLTDAYKKIKADNNERDGTSAAPTLEQKQTNKELQTDFESLKSSIEAKDIQLTESSSFINILLSKNIDLTLTEVKRLLDYGEKYCHHDLQLLDKIKIKAQDHQCCWNLEMVDSLVTLKCKHKFCDSCLVEYISHKTGGLFVYNDFELKNEGCSYPTCPECQSNSIDLGIIKQVLKKDFILYQKQARIREHQKNPIIIQCKTCLQELSETLFFDDVELCQDNCSECLLENIRLNKPYCSHCEKKIPQDFIDRISL